MNGTTLAEKRRAIALQDGVCLHQDTPEAVGVDGVVGGVYFIFITANGIAHFARQRVDRDIDPQGMQAVHEFPVKCSDGTWDQWQRFGGPVASENVEVMIDEIKVDGKAPALIGNGRGRQPTRGDVQRDMPPMVHWRTQLHSYLAHDLRPHVKGIKCLFPCFIGQRWPEFCRFSFCLIFRVHGSSQSGYLLYPLLFPM